MGRSSVVSLLIAALSMFFVPSFAVTDSTVTVTNYKTITTCSSGATCTTQSPTSTAYQTAVTTITSCSSGAKCSTYSTAINTPSASVVYETYTTSVLTTYCPAATTLTVNNRTYTVSAPKTLTFSNCPCTIARTTTSGGQLSSVGSSIGQTTPTYTATIKTATLPSSNATSLASYSSTGPGYPAFTGAADAAKPFMPYLVLGALALL